MATITPSASGEEFPLPRLATLGDMNEKKWGEYIDAIVTTHPEDGHARNTLLARLNIPLSIFRAKYAAWARGARKTDGGLNAAVPAAVAKPSTLEINGHKTTVSATPMTKETVVTATNGPDPNGPANTTVTTPTRAAATMIPPEPKAAPAEPVAAKPEPAVEVPAAQPPVAKPAAREANGSVQAAEVPSSPAAMKPIADESSPVATEPAAIEIPSTRAVMPNHRPEPKHADTSRQLIERISAPPARPKSEGMKMPAWIHKQSQSDPALDFEREADRHWSEVTLDQTHLIMKGDPGMEKVWERICTAAKGESCVLIRGETGVGKEPLSHAIHILHNRGNENATYWRINCAGIAESLAESELFGHERGAFTGADKEHKGAFEIVDNGGTLLLDEVGDMPLALQAKLLRAIENREYIRVGSDKIRKLNKVKIVAATNRPLEEMIAEGKFRKDLYGRLRAEEIHVPSLDERGPQHRMELIGHFLQMLGKQYDRIPGMTQEAFEFLMSDEVEYLENVRGLRDHLERAFKMACMNAGKNVDIDLHDIQSSVPSTPDSLRNTPALFDGSSEGIGSYYNDALAIGLSSEGDRMNVTFDLSKFEGNGDVILDTLFKILCHAAVRFCGDNQSKAAKVLNITRGTLRNKLRSNTVLRNLDTKVSFSVKTDGELEQ